MHSTVRASVLARSLYDGKKQGESDRPGENNETTLSTLTPCPDAANTLLPSRTTLFFWDTRECAVNVLASSGPSGLPLEESENRQVLNGRAYSKRASSRMFYSYLSSTWYAGVTFPLACPCVHFSLRVANLNQVASRSRQSKSSLPKYVEGWWLWLEKRGRPPIRPISISFMRPPVH